MKGDTYYLKDKEGLIGYKFVVDSDDFSLSGTCYETYSWDIHGTPFEYSFVANVYCKWDACTHWYFYGEDYNPDAELDEKEQDAYYHLCGGYSFMGHITAMCFVWKLAEQIISKDPWTIRNSISGYTHDEYYDHERIKQLIDLVLNGYEIMKG